MAKTVGFIGGKFLPFHLGHMYAIVSASNFVDKLYVVLSHAEKRDRELCARDRVKYMPKETRLSWLGGCLSDLENIHITCVEVEDWDDWGTSAEAVKTVIPETITHTFSSDPDTRDMFEQYYDGAEHIILDRNVIDIGGEELRHNLYQYWASLPEIVRAFFVKKIAFVGTESCGKSTLAKKLSKFFNTTMVHEVGRDYCLAYLDQLTVDMFDSIAMDHFRLCEQKLLVSNKFLMIDSEAVITQYYLDMYFQRQSPLIEEIIKKQSYDLILFLEPDIEWVDDGIRFAGEEGIREQNNRKLKQMLRDRGFDFVEITGSYEDRFVVAKGLIESLIKS